MVGGAFGAGGLLYHTGGRGLAAGRRREGADRVGGCGGWDGMRRPRFIPVLFVGEPAVRAWGYRNVIAWPSYIYEPARPCVGLPGRGRIRWPRRPTRPSVRGATGEAGQVSRQSVNPPVRAWGYPGSLRIATTILQPARPCVGLPSAAMLLPPSSETRPSVRGATP